MRKIAIALLIVMMTSVLAGCGCDHKWQSATCEEPKTCKLCGETEGEPLGHDWQDATCEKPKTCANCGKTEGEALGHDWEEATCTEPKTCKRCGATEGEPLGHDFTPATLDAPKTCTRCGATEGEPVSFKKIDLDFLGEPYMKRVINEDMCVAVEDTKDHHLKVTFYDLNGNVVHEHDLNLNRSDGGYDGWIYSFVKDGYMLATGNEKKTEITVYDYDFNTIMEERLDEFLCNGNPNNTAELDSNSFNGINRVYNKNKETTYFGVDFNNGCECSVEDFYNAASNYGVDPDYDLSKWSCYIYQDRIKGYFVGTKDEKSWGFIDLDGNEIRMFKDATDFTSSGYALVSNDGKSYDLIDTDFNVIKEGIVEAKGASIYENTNVINVFNEDGSEDHFLVQ